MGSGPGLGARCTVLRVAAPQRRLLGPGLGPATRALPYPAPPGLAANGCGSAAADTAGGFGVGLWR